MHDHLADWYRTAGIGVDGETLPKRGEAIEAFSPDRADIPPLARLFYSLGGDNTECLATFRAKLKENDATFAMAGNDREIAVLAGAELVDVIERSQEPQLADLAALALVCPSAHNLRASPAVPDIPERAKAYLGKRATERTASGDASDAAPGTAEGITFLKQQGPHWPKVGETIERLTKECNSLRTVVPLLSEECNMLWWLFGDWSRDLKKRWRDVPRSAVPLIAGKEACDLTQVMPGHPCVLAFLDKVVRSAYPKVPATVALKDSVNALPQEWRAAFAGTRKIHELEALAPVAQAVNFSLKAAGADAWPPFFQQATGVATNAGLAPTALAYQVYQEALLFRAWESAGGQS
jgi:hypothetical protein